MKAGTIKKTLAGLTVVAASIVTVAGPASAAENTSGDQNTIVVTQPQSVEKVYIPAARVPKFSAGSALKQSVKGG